MSDVFREAVRLRQLGEKAALVIVTAVNGHTPQVAGAKMLVHADGHVTGTIGGGRIEQVVTERALEVLTGKDSPTVATYNLKAELGMCCGGRMDIYIEPIGSVERLILFGAGHVAGPTAHLATLCGFQVTVVDDRPDWNSLERFPDVAERVVLPYEDFLHDFTFRSSDYVVISTPSHDFDREVLAHCIITEAGYVGMIGSTRKVHKALLALEARGLPAEVLRRTHAPIGLDILAETPEEIAVSIVGELIRERRQGRSLKSTRGAPVKLLSEQDEGTGPPRPVEGETIPDGIS